MALFVAVAHTGKTLQLGVHPSQRVEAVQQALVTFTGVPVMDQILMLAGSKLDAARPLSAYKLPMEDPAAAADEPLILYCKSHLKARALPPPPEQLPAITPKVPPPLDGTAMAAAASGHPLASSPHAEIRALPAYEAAFSHHARAAAAYWEASSARLARCRQLLSEQEVQSRAADAATVNVEAHYQWITAAMAGFMTRYGEQCASHAQLLASFSEDQALLDSISLHPGLQAPQWRRLADLPLAVRAREGAASCRRHHGQFAAKVSQLEGVYDSMKLDMEALIMQAPSVDLDALGAQLADAEVWLQEQAAIVQALSKDLSTVQQLVERVVRQSVAPGGGAAGHVRTAPGTAPSGDWPALLDAAAAVAAVATAHTATQLPRAAALDAAAAVLEEKAVAAKQQMTADVVAMLQRISQQQSKIRDMRGRLSAFEALLNRQAAQFAELQPMGRLPAAYHAVLAECERRRAWHQLKVGQAAEFVEQLVAQYQQEAGKRQRFVQQVDRYIPVDLLAAAGLLETGAPPLPTVTVPPPPADLLPVSLDDVRALPAPAPTIALAMAALSQLLQPPSEPSGSGAEVGPAGGHPERGEQEEGDFAPPLPPPISMHRLEMENARLRAELADVLAGVSLQRLQQALATHGTAPALHDAMATAAATGGGPGSQQVPAPGRGSGLGAAVLQRSISGSSWRRATSVAPGQFAAPVPAGPASTAGSPAAHPGGPAAHHGRSVSMTPSAPSAGTSPSARPAVSAPAIAPAPFALQGSVSPGAMQPPAAAATAVGLFAAAGTGTAGPGSGGGARGADEAASGPSLGVPTSAVPGPSPTTAQRMQASVSASLAYLPASSCTTRQGHPDQQEPGGGSLPLSLTPQPDVQLAEGAAVAALHQVVTVKERFCVALQHEVHVLSGRVSSYESRIGELEELIARLQREQLTAGVMPPAPAAAVAGGVEMDDASVGTPHRPSAAIGAESSSSRAEPHGRLPAAPSQQALWQVTDSSEGTWGMGASGGGGAQPPPPAPHALDSESFDPLMGSSCMFGGSAPEAALTLMPETIVPHDGDTARTVLATVGGTAQPATTATDLLPVATPGSAVGGALSTAPPASSILGPIALAALGGSRGHTPEPRDPTGLVDVPLAGLPMLLAQRATSPDPFAPWHISSLADPGVWDAARGGAGGAPRQQDGDGAAADPLACAPTVEAAAAPQLGQSTATPPPAHVPAEPMLGDIPAMEGAASSATDLAARVTEGTAAPLAASAVADVAAADAALVGSESVPAAADSTPVGSNEALVPVESVPVGAGAVSLAADSVPAATAATDAAFGVAESSPVATDPTAVLATSGPADPVLADAPGQDDTDSGGQQAQDAQPGVPHPAATDLVIEGAASSAEEAASCSGPEVADNAAVLDAVAASDGHEERLQAGVEALGGGAGGEVVPDIDDVMAAAATSAEAIHALDMAAPVGGIAAEPRTWPAAGSGLMDSGASGAEVRDEGDVELHGTAQRDAAGLSPPQGAQQE